MESKAELSSFALELSKRMHMRYSSPPMPVDLTMKDNTVPPPPPPKLETDFRGRLATAESCFGEENYDEVAGMFGSPRSK